MENNNEYKLKKENKERARMSAERKRELMKTGKKVALWLVAILAVGSLIFGAVRIASGPARAELAVPITENDWMLGDPEAPAILVEYGDFQCGACATYFPVIHELQQEFGDQLSFVYRHFPLNFAYSDLTALMAEAAGQQGKFWEMYNLLFDHQDEWTRERNQNEVINYLATYMKGLNLDEDKLRTDLNSRALLDRIRADSEGGRRAGVKATPTFFLNGQKIQNPRTYDEFHQLIQNAIDQANQSVETATSTNS
jgi:protein-disulfide isomerase